MVLFVVTWSVSRPGCVADSFGTKNGAPDFVVAEHVSVLDSSEGSTMSIIGDPSNAPVPRGWLYLRGLGGGACGTPTACPGPASIGFSYEMLRLDVGVTHTRSFDVVGTPAACYRPALAWSLSQYPAFWSATHGGASRYVDGLGSYSSYLGNLTDPVWTEMAYQTNWDLSGRFFPYQGQFLPPMPSSTAQWENDPEGTQARANCSYASIDANYAAGQQSGFSTL